MILDQLTDFRCDPIYARVSKLLENRFNILLKLEGFNPGGSIKLKPAIGLIRDLQRNKLLEPGSILIETTSGNMGIALAAIARSMGYGFVCVSDEKMTTHNRNLVRAYGAEVVIMERSNLQERYAFIREQMAYDKRFVWPRQFENDMNPIVHEATTAQEILSSLDRVDHLFVGVGTGGTLAGCSKVFAEKSPWTRIIAVDAEGSKHFDDTPTVIPRKIPGIGATVRSPFLDQASIHRVVIVSEDSAIEHCKMLLQQTGWLLGGSSGSVLSAILSSADHFRDGETIVGICADFGERYLDSVYAEEQAVAVDPLSFITEEGTVAVR